MDISIYPWLLFCGVKAAWSAPANQTIGSACFPDLAPALQHSSTPALQRRRAGRTRLLHHLIYTSRARVLQVVVGHMLGHRASASPVWISIKSRG